MIAVNSLTVRYPGRRAPALRELSFTVAEGETVLLLGPSGSGKSTLALALNGIIPHGLAAEMTGQVSIGGRETRDMGPGEIAALVGVVFQDPEAQFTMLTVEDEVAFGLENLRVSRAEMDARIDEALHATGLEDMRGRRLDRLSGGEKQRLALACILAMRPPVIVLDEPTANLDPLGTREFFATLAGLRGGRTLLLIEHKLDECAALAGRALVLGPEGDLIADGPPRTVFREHAAELERFGVWIPQVAEYALAHDWPGELPLTVAEAAARPEAEWVLTPAIPTADGAGQERAAALEVSGLTFGYAEGQLVLRDVHLLVPEGDFAVLVGPNGSGKSTLAALAIGLREPPPGTARLFGEDVRALSVAEIAERAGYVFQNPEHQFVADTVRDELAYSLRARGRPGKEIADTVRGLLERFGLEGLAGANPFTLSQGQKRRLSVATMLAVGQRLLILDEPTFGQDRRSSTRLMEMLDALNLSGVTLLMITHDMRLAAEWARTAHVLAEGRILFSGAPAELFERDDVLAAARLIPPPLVELARRGAGGEGRRAVEGRGGRGEGRGREA